MLYDIKYYIKYYNDIIGAILKKNSKLVIGQTFFSRYKLKMNSK